MGALDNEFADLIPKDSGKDFSSDFTDLLPKDTGRDFAADFADLAPAVAPPKSEPPQTARPARMTLTRGGQPKLAPDTPAPPAGQSTEDYVIENVGGSLVRGVEQTKRIPPVLSMLSASRVLDDYNAIDKGDMAAMQRPGADEAKFYFTRSKEGRTKLRAEAAAKVTESVAELVERSKTLQGMKQDPDVEKALKAETIDEFWDAFKKKPFTFMLNVGLESLPQSMLGVAAAIPGGVLGGVPGAAGALGAGSGLVDYSASVLEALVRRGVNLTDEAAVKKASADPALLQEAKDIAFRGAVAVGAFDAASVGMLVKRLGKTFVANALKQLGGQAVLGAGGEAVKQHLQQEGYQFGQIAAEAAGEIVQAVPEAGAVAAVQAVKPTAAQARAQVVAKELEQSVEATDLTAGTEQVAVDLLRPENAQMEMRSVPITAPQPVEISTPSVAVQQETGAQPVSESQIAAPEAAAAPPAAVQAAPGEAPAAAPMPEPQPAAARASEPEAEPDAVIFEDIPDDLDIREDVLVEDTGETVKVKRNAREAFMEADQKVNRYRALIECMQRG